MSPGNGEGQTDAEPEAQLDAERGSKASGTAQGPQSSCDALLLDDNSRSDTYATIRIGDDDVNAAHDANVSIG